MQNIAKIYNTSVDFHYLGPARVLETDPAQDYVKVYVEGFKGNQENWAIKALSSECSLKSGDEVLVVSENIDEIYIIGVLNQKKPAICAMKPQNQIVLPDGAVAKLKEYHGKPKLNLYSKRNELIFEYDPEKGQARIIQNSGDLKIDAPNGNLKLSAAKNVMISGHNIDFAGRSGVKLSVGNIYEKIRSSLSLKPGTINISGRKIEVRAKQAVCFLEELRENIKKNISNVKYARIIAEKVETIADTVIEKTKNSYRSTENLTQHKAGRMRMLIDSTFHLKSRNSVLKAKKDIKIKSDKIHLG